MNNKTLIGIIVVLVIIGGALLFTGNKSTQPTETTTQQGTPAQNTTNQGTTGGIVPKETITNVAVTSSGFEPKTVTVKIGTRVIWLNNSGADATVNSAVHPTHQIYPPLNLGQFPDGSSVQLVFDKAGTYKYHDHLHPERTGTVVVQ
ncbi:MAG: hypothetical protein A2629_01995 [Candidatus Levybacteria bacterium RIFCSPHIGHO2_01_FULL_41_15]|nr:MAG: hypothetical protein A2629_01995 [Candidatus Levybacteria bacterium RIFCSPHIGHO2_01_FULL_41_15]